MNDSKELSLRDRMSVAELQRTQVRLVRKQQAPLGAPARAKKFGSEGRLRGLWDTLRRNRRTVLAGFAAVFAPVVLWALLAPPVYEAELRILVKAEGPEARGSHAGPVSAQEVQSEIELLRSRELLGQVVRQGLAGKPESSEAGVERAVRRLEEDLEVAAVPDTSLIAMRYAGPDAKQAAGLLNGLAALYMQKRAALDHNGEALQFFHQETGYRGEELEQAQQAMAQFSNANQVSLLDEQKGAALNRIEALEVDLAGVSGEIQASRRRLEQLGRQRGELPQTVTTATRSARNQALIEKLKTQLMELENQRTELLARYEPGYRLVVEIDKKIADTRAAVEGEQQSEVVDQTEGLNPIRQSVEAEYFRTQTALAGLEARQRELRRKLAEQRERESRLVVLTAEHETLARGLKLAEDKYLRYEERKEQARIANALDRAQLMRVSIVESAKEPALPTEGHTAVVMLLGLLLASCSGVGAAVVKDRMYRPVVNAAEVAALTGLPVLGAGEITTR